VRRRAERAWWRFEVDVALAAIAVLALLFCLAVAFA